MQINPMSHGDYTSKPITIHTVTDTPTIDIKQEIISRMNTSKQTRRKHPNKLNLLLSSRSSKSSLYDSFTDDINPERNGWIGKLRIQRKQAEDQIQKTENKYFFYASRMECDRKRRDIQSVKDTRRSRIIEENSRQKVLNSRSIHRHERIEYTQKRRLHQGVFDQRTSKLNSTKQLFQDNLSQADELRAKKEQCHDMIQAFQEEFYEEKLEMVKHGRADQQKRQDSQRERSQRKMNDAKFNYRRKWMEEYYKSQKAQLKAKKKSLIINSKILEIIDNAKSEELSMLKKKEQRLKNYIFLNHQSRAVDFHLKAEIYSGS